MPKRSTFRPYELSAKSVARKKLVIEKFLGVDYSPAQLQVANNHAVDIQNFIYKDDVVQKREGFEQLLQASKVWYHVKTEGGFEYRENPVQVNGVWSFVGLDNQRYIVAHIGKILFKITGLGKNASFLDVSLEPIFYSNSQGYTDLAVELNNTYSMAFEGDHKLYILGGNKYYVLRVNSGEFTLTAVEEDEETYIPTTTIGITYKDSSVNLRTGLDDVNLMTQWRKNKLASGTYVDDGVTLRTSRFWDYELDTSIVAKKQKDLNDVVITIETLEGEM